MRAATHSSFHPGRSANLLMQGDIIGAFGEIHPEVARSFKLTGAPVIYAELKAAPLVRYHQRLHQVQPLPTKPAMLEGHCADCPCQYSGKRG